MPVIIDNRLDLTEQLQQGLAKHNIVLYTSFHSSDYLGHPPKQHVWWHYWATHKGHETVLSVFRKESIYIGATMWQMWKTHIQPIVTQYEEFSGKSVNIYVNYDGGNHVEITP